MIAGLFFNLLQTDCMNRKITYIITVLIFFVGTAFIVYKYQHNRHTANNFYYELKERKGPLATEPGWAKTQVTAENLYRSLSYNPKDVKSALSLATIFIKEARITGNYAYYDVAAMKQADMVLEQDPGNFQALTYKALLYLSQHHFADGLAIANKARDINPYNAFIYGILVDANVEMGKYQDAIDNADKMISIRPDLRSYSRISYLREIHGDYKGAKDAMKLAVGSGVDGDDGTEWARVQLGRLYENTGAPDTAAFEYAQSLAYRHSYAPALAGEGHIAFVQKDYQKAQAAYAQAEQLTLDYSIRENLAELARARGDIKASNALYNTIIADMTREASSANGDENMGHYVDRELAQVYLMINENDKALDHALAEYNRRPENIDVNETLGWVYYKRGESSKALTHMTTALRTGCKNPTLLCHAGLVFAKAGNKAKAKELLTSALANNPGIDPELKMESENMLKEL